MPVEVTCPTCNKKHNRWPAQAHRIYCSRVCADARWGADRIERFWGRVEKTGDCWLWTLGCNARGYGVVSWGTAGRQLAHRIAWEITYGAIPSGLYVCHHCDNPPCVRPDHLFVGSDSDNVHDCIAKGRFPSGARNGMRLHPERHVRGESHGAAKLSADQVREMRRLYDPGVVSYETLARRFGVKPSTVVHIIRGDNWKHLLED